MPKLNQEVCRGIKVKVPSLTEQSKIGKMLTLMNERIEAQIRIIEKLQSLMKGLAEHLTAFTPNTKIADCLNCHSSILQENQVKNEGAPVGRNSVSCIGQNQSLTSLLT